MAIQYCENKWRLTVWAKNQMAFWGHSEKPRRSESRRRRRVLIDRKDYHSMKDGGPRIKLRNYSGRVIKPSVERYDQAMSKTLSRKVRSRPRRIRQVCLVCSGPASGTIFLLAEIQNASPASISSRSSASGDEITKSQRSCTSPIRSSAFPVVKAFHSSK